MRVDCLRASKLVTLGYITEYMNRKFKEQT